MTGESSRRYRVDRGVARQEPVTTCRLHSRRVSAGPKRDLPANGRCSKAPAVLRSRRTPAGRRARRRPTVHDRHGESVREALGGIDAPAHSSSARSGKGGDGSFVPGFQQLFGERVEVRKWKYPFRQFIVNKRGCCACGDREPTCSMWKRFSSAQSGYRRGPCSSSTTPLHRTSPRSRSGWPRYRARSSKSFGSTRIRVG